VRRGHLGGWVWGFLLLTLFTARGEFQIERATDRVTIHQEAGPMVTFVYRDPQVPRPYFMHWHAPDGFLLTRRFPPVEGLDATDHETMHPGIWLSFSGISGSDFWRNKAPTTFGGFTEEPFVRDGVAGWSFRNHYATTSGPTVTEECTIRFADRPLGTLLFWDSAFTSTGEVVFEDHEEMGLGIRVATILSVKNGGKMRNSFADENEKGVWGKKAGWIDYSRDLRGTRHGILLVPHRENDRPSYFHARDYGMMTANPFGTKSFTHKGDGSYKLVVGQKIRLRFGIFAYAGEIDPAGIAADYHITAEETSRRSSSAIK
jgi:hypothetical protein